MSDMTKEKQFFERLKKLPTGERAALKRVCGGRLNDADAKAFGVFYKVLPHGVSEWQEDRWFCAACLSCLWQTGDEAKLLFEECLSKLKADSSESFENRVIAMLDNEWNEDGRLGLKLYRMLKLIRQKGFGIDMAALLTDLCKWDNQNRSVQKKWARAFCGATELKIEEEN